MQQTTVRRVAWALMVVALYAAAVVGLDRFDWGLGYARALLLALIALALSGSGSVSAAAVPRPFSRVLVAILLALLIWRSADIVRAYRANDYRPIDIATTTVTAVAITGTGASPYATTIDRRRETTSASGFGFFNGYKYGPMNVLWYYPLTRAYGLAGIYFTNFVFYLATAALLVVLGRAYSPSADASVGLAAAALFAATPFVWKESAYFGVNDVVQAALLLAALLLRVHGMGAVAGAVVGLALASKLMPGIALFIALLALPRRVPFVASVIAVAGLLFMTQFPAAPKEMVANLILFLAQRDPDSAGLRYFLPAWIGALWTLLAGGVLTALAARHLLRADDGAAAIVRFLTLFLAAFFFFTDAHRNYLIWFCPLLALQAAQLALCDPCPTPPSS